MDMKGIYFLDTVVVSVYGLSGMSIHHHFFHILQQTTFYLLKCMCVWRNYVYHVIYICSS